MKPLNQLTTQDLIQMAKEVDRKTWYKIAGGVVGGIVLLVFLIWPAWFKRVQIRVEINDIKNQLAGLELLNQQKPELLKHQEEYKKYIQNAKPRLYQPGETSLLLGSISKLADQSKVAILASKPEEGEQTFPAPFDQQYDGDLYQFTVEGGYHALGEFISKIENNSKLLRVQVFTLSPQEEKAQSHEAEMVLSVVSLKKARAGVPVPVPVRTSGAPTP